MAIHDNSLRTLKVQVYEVRKHGRTPEGSAIFELRTSSGRFRTASRSLASQRLNPWVFPSEGRTANLILNRRGTVQDVGYLK